MPVGYYCGDILYGRRTDHSRMVVLVQPQTNSRLHCPSIIAPVVHTFYHTRVLVFPFDSSTRIHFLIGLGMIVYCGSLSRCGQEYS